MSPTLAISGDDCEIPVDLLQIRTHSPEKQRIGCENRRVLLPAEVDLQRRRLDQGIERRKVGQRQTGGDLNTGNQQQEEQIGNCEIQNSAVKRDFSRRIVFHQWPVDWELIMILNWPAQELLWRRA